MDNHQSNKAKENKKEDKKALKKFWVILIGSGLFGLVLGISSSFLGDSFLGSSGFGLQSEEAKQVIKQLGIFGSFAVSTVLLFVIVVFYRQAKKLYHSWDGEDEEVYNRIETKLSYALMVTSIEMIFGYFFFSFGIYVTEFWELSDAMIKMKLWEFWIILCGMIYATASASIAQQKIVNFEKELNPEKKGSVYDPKFNEKWMETSDEAERLIIYKSAYRAFRIMQLAFQIAWVICLLGMMTFETGLFPMIMVLALWMVMVCAYCIHSIYYAKHPSEVMK